MSTTDARPADASHSARQTAEPGTRSGLGSRLLDMGLAIAGIAMVVAVATVPLSAREQALFALGTAVVFLAVNWLAARGVTMFLVALSLAVSLRYIFWRVTETLDFASPLEWALGAGLALAECYAIVALVLGYIQTAWPLDRAPLPLPADAGTWPFVDVYVTTYDEPLSQVRASVLAAMAMDWPRDKMRVWLLDDGRRDEFRRFAEACGCGYIAREGNAYAKAGNLNHALGVTDGEFICVFDCDHIPTRAFLQLTTGWLVDRPNLAVVQTPHQFRAPDRFQRSLAAGARVFHGVAQNGSDYWNACVFSGSCAVIRRAAVAGIGGFAVETVAEDVHTVLRLHRRGWDSAYLKLPLAGGLAAEPRGGHIAQRARRARGMLQILRLDNPLFGPGLTLGQRICYLQAIGHSLSAIPRLIFLSAPLAYLLLGQHIIAASPLALAAYGLPHIAHAVATNARIRTRWRHSLWRVAYATVLAPFMVGVTISTLLFPRRSRSSVTAKGGLMPQGFLDLGAVYPNLILALLLGVGLARGLVSLVFAPTDPPIAQALLLNSIWASLSLLIVLAALAVSREGRENRASARVPASLRACVTLADGRILHGLTRDLSQAGGTLIVARPANAGVVAGLAIRLEVGSGAVTLPAEALRWDGPALQVRWTPRTLAEEARVIGAVFGRADTWSGWADYPDARPRARFGRVFASIGGLVGWRDRRAPDLSMSGATDPADASPAAASVGARAAGRRLAGSVVAALLLLASASQALAESRAGTTIRPIPQRVFPLRDPLPLASAPEPPPPVPPPAAAIESAPSARQALAHSPDAMDEAGRPGVRRVLFNLRQLGARGPLAMRGIDALQGVDFGIHADEVVTQASLSVSGAMSPNLIAQVSTVTVTLNDQYVGTIPVERDHADVQIDMPISPSLFRSDNRLNFRFSGRYATGCNDPLSGLLWATVSDTSTLMLVLERLPPRRDLARLPLPFLDSHERQTVSVPFVLANGPDNSALRAAGIVSSWFGQQAGPRDANFPAMTDIPGAGNAVAIVTGGEGPKGLALPLIGGPTLAVVANPNDRLGSVLVVAGRTGEEVVTAATALAMSSRALGGDVAVVSPPDVPAREPYDAPNWIATDRPVRFGELVDVAALQTHGYAGLVHVPFRTAPDLYTWRDQPFPMHVRYRAPPGPILDVGPSRLDVGINGSYLDTFSLAARAGGDGWVSRLLDTGAGAREGRVDVPAYDVAGHNDLQFQFDARPLRRGECAAIPDDLRMGIDPDSTIDLSHAYRFAVMPNLASFVNSGFPFTRYADLSQTAVVVSDEPSSVEIGAYLDLMGRLGAQTGLPAVRVVVVRPDDAGTVADRDLLVVGTLARLQGTTDLFRRAPVRLNVNRLEVSLPGALDGVRRLFGDSAAMDRRRAVTQLSTELTETTAVILGGESPLQSGRSMVAVLATTSQGLGSVLNALGDRARTPLIGGDLALFAGGQITSYRVGDTYSVGALPFWVWPSSAMGDRPLGTAVVMLIGCALCGLALHLGLRRKAGRRLSHSGRRIGRVGHRTAGLAREHPPP